MPYIYEYPRPAITVDLALISQVINNYKILLIKRKNPPFENFWAFPGGFVDQGESLEMALFREVFEEVSLEIYRSVQFKTYSAPGRDPRGHTVSTVFLSFCESEDLNPIPGDDAIDYKWFLIDRLPKMAFDHALIINEIFDYLKSGNTKPINYFISQ
jgi:8-oxo-dGTP diphosphatase